METYRHIELLYFFTSNINIYKGVYFSLEAFQEIFELFFRIVFSANECCTRTMSADMTAMLMLHLGSRVTDVARTLCCAHSSVVLVYPVWRGNPDITISGP